MIEFTIKYCNSHKFILLDNDVIGWIVGTVLFYSDELSHSTRIDLRSWFYDYAERPLPNKLLITIYTELSK